MDAKPRICHALEVYHPVFTRRSLSTKGQDVDPFDSRSHHGGQAGQVLADDQGEKSVGQPDMRQVYSKMIIPTNICLTYFVE